MCFWQYKQCAFMFHKKEVQKDQSMREMCLEASKGTVDIEILTISRNGVRKIMNKALSRII